MNKSQFCNDPGKAADVRAKRLTTCGYCINSEKNSKYFLFFFN